VKGVIMMWLILISILYLLANVVDFILTKQGLARGLNVESSPIVLSYYEPWGLKGIILLKGLMVVVVCTEFALVKIQCIKKGRKKYTAEILLFVAAILTTTGGLLWLRF